jgi:hypothetical protein
MTMIEIAGDCFDAISDAQFTKSMRDILCTAIKSRHLVKFSYEGAIRIV